VFICAPYLHRAPAFTTDESFQDCVFVVNQPRILKRVELKQLSFYLQSDNVLAAHQPDFFDDVFEDQVRARAPSALRFVEFRMSVIRLD
jgi:hypothetical protein